ncbi:hypothetical protein RIF29_13551 [Crotalaria pallida]|uniref:F-box domain-containing protein n=1 Tax=Crotalaria pallida TaxID=3830 RepID=A0AAN9P2A7_CROPI
MQPDSLWLALLYPKFYNSDFLSVLLEYWNYRLLLTDWRLPLHKGSSMWASLHERRLRLLIRSLLIRENRNASTRVLSSTLQLIFLTRRSSPPIIGFMAPCVRKADRVGHNNIDRISDLPVNVIECILCHLPIRDVVRTSILSRKWRYIWFLVPQLEFGFDFFLDCHDRNIGNQVPGIITDILLLHSGPVSKFTLKIPRDFSMEITCLYKWILFLSKRGIEDLDLACYQDESQKMSSHLFYCQGLKYLKLDCFKLSLPPDDFHSFKSLLDLQLLYVEFEFGALERLISSCPILDSLTIEHCYGSDCINISSPTLTVLCIEQLHNIKSICLKNAKNLTYLTLKIEYASIIPQLLLDSITSLKYLKLESVDFNEPEELLFMAALLKSSPNLVELVIRSYGGAVAPLPNHQRAIDYYNSCCLSQLQKVNITVGTACEHALDLTRFLLANSPSLEILTFEVWIGLEHYEKLLTISQDLLGLGRASPRAEVKFLYSGNTKK